ncbi:MAG: endonuclease III domain-containing protein [Candidatus Diapherotrites archaeon]|nr:endonuclease III domain-containing protein [Candidatus Diapherotrites archaeon]
MRPIQLYNSLFENFGAQHWWPAANGKNRALEICIGAILTQNTSWKNVEKALAELHRHKMIDIGKISKCNSKKLAALIRSSGYHNQKAKTLKAFCSHLLKNCNGNLGGMLSRSIPELRAELLALHGIGNETADSIILYAAHKPAFVIDAYTKRIAGRLGISSEQNYEKLQGFFESRLEKNAQLFNEFHALLVQFGKEFCKKKPECGECFLNGKCNYYSSSG